MTDLLNDSLTERLRWFRHADVPVVLFTGASLDADRRVDPARLLAGALGSRVTCILDDRSAVDSTADLPSWSSVPPIPVRPDLDADMAVDNVAVVLAVDVPLSSTLLVRHVAMLRSAADRGAHVFTTHLLGRAHPNVVDLKRIGVTDRVRFTNADRRSHRVMVYEVNDPSSEASSYGASTRTSLELCTALQNEGIVADWLPSSPVGLLLRGFGRCLDRAGLDQAGGITEGLLQIIEPQADVIVVEGSGSIADPATSVRSIAQATVAQPTSHLIAHRVPAVRNGDQDDFITGVLDPIRRRIDHLHDLAGQRSIFLGVALECSAVSSWEARSLIAEIEGTGVRCVDASRDIGRFARIVAAHEGTA